MTHIQRSGVLKRQRCRNSIWQTYFQGLIQAKYKPWSAIIVIILIVIQQDVTNIINYQPNIYFIPISER